jgi:hypothetical protein
LSTWQELEDLQKKKAELEFHVYLMEEREKNLLEQSGITEERLGNQELEEFLKVKHDSVELLESKISEPER